MCTRWRFHPSLTPGLVSEAIWRKSRTYLGRVLVTTPTVVYFANISPSGISVCRVHLGDICALVGATFLQQFRFFAGSELIQSSVFSVSNTTLRNESILNEYEYAYREVFWASDDPDSCFCSR